MNISSTGYFSFFCHHKYDAYLNALISTGIIPPKKNILFSIGSYREKLELLPAIQKLSAAGYNIFATSGTADFLTEHNVPCKVSSPSPNYCNFASDSFTVPRSIGR